MLLVSGVQAQSKSTDPAPINQETDQNQKGTHDFGETVAAATVLHGQCYLLDQNNSPQKQGNVTVWVCGADRFRSLDSWIFSQIKGKLDDLIGRANEAMALRQPERARALLDQYADTLENRWGMLANCPCTETNQDGKFELTHHLKPPYVIFTYGRLTVNGKVAHYVWRLRSDNIDPAKELILSNENAVLVSK